MPGKSSNHLQSTADAASLVVQSEREWETPTGRYRGRIDRYIGGRLEFQWSLKGARELEDDAK